MAIKNGILGLDGVIQLRGGVAATLSLVNPLVVRREIMVEIDTGKMKIGDGVKRWNSLPYSSGSISMPPNDNNLYGIKNNSWVEISSSGAEIPVEKSFSITLTASHISQKYINLPNNCDTTREITLTIQSFPTERDIDWELNENKISWSGFELENIAQAGDKVFIKYY